MYKLIHDSDTISRGNISFFPNEDNREGRKYLKWLAKGNTPAPADKIIKTWQQRRQEEYLKQGTTREAWIDLDMANNTIGKAAFREKYFAIRDSISEDD